MFYEVDQAAQANRAFSKTALYSQIDWTNLDQIVDAYRERIQDWYLDPAKELAKNVHFAFAVMALNCLLIDTLSQFVAGIESSDNGKFKDFIRSRLPSIYSCRLSTTVHHYDGKQATLGDVADVLYHGFRCGILHQAHIPPYGGVDPGARHAAHAGMYGLVKYKSSGADCPSIIVNPLILLADLDDAFESYVQELKDRDSKNDDLRAKFKKKFSSSFGVDVNTAA